jgi:hypothetical protein
LLPTMEHVEHNTRRLKDRCTAIEGGSNGSSSMYH